MKTKYTIGLIIVTLISCNNQKLRPSDNDCQKPVRTDSENVKQINIFDITDFKNNTTKLKFVSERLISIKENKFDIGDSTCYFFNTLGQLTKKTTYTNNDKLKYLTEYKYNERNQLIAMTSKGFDGESPFNIFYSYNSLGQVSSSQTRSSYVNENNYFDYDTLNYLVKKETKNLNRVTNYSYDCKGNLVMELILNDKRDTITKSDFMYNQLSQCVESKYSGEPINCVGRYKWVMQYNKIGDLVEKTSNGFTVKYQYEYDKADNWTKQFSFYNEETSPNFLTRRQILYYD